MPRSSASRMPRSGSPVRKKSWELFAADAALAASSDRLRPRRNDRRPAFDLAATARGGLPAGQHRHRSRFAADAARPAARFARKKITISSKAAPTVATATNRCSVRWRAAGSRKRSASPNAAAVYFHRPRCGRIRHHGQLRRWRKSRPSAFADPFEAEAAAAIAAASPDRQRRGRRRGRSRRARGREGWQREL